MDLKKTIKRYIVTRVLKRNLPLSLTYPNYSPPLLIKPLDYRKDKITFCNINFDDLCPIYLDDYGLDFGGRPGEGVALGFEELLKDYPYIGVTHFLIPACQIGKSVFRNNRLRDRYDISSPTHHNWIEFYKGLAETYNIEYAQHGYCHRQYENRFFGRHTEFAYKHEAESLRTIKNGLEILNRAGIEVYGFRQPGWDISSDLSICRVLQSLRYVYIAGSSSDAGFNASQARVSSSVPVLINGIINFPQNVLLDWTLEKMKHEIDRIVSVNGLISIKGHFVNKGMPNAFSTENISKLRHTLDYLAKKYEKRIAFVTMKDLAAILRQQPRNVIAENSDES